MISTSDVYNIKLFPGAEFTLLIILLHVNNYM